MKAITVTATMPDIVQPAAETTRDIRVIPAIPARRVIQVLAIIPAHFTGEGGSMIE